MKKLFTYLFASILFIGAAQAQRMPIHAVSKNEQSIAQHRSINPPNSTNALFDIQFGDLLTPINVVSCVYTGTEFWVGRYTTDTLYTLDTLGNITSTFVVTGVGTSTVGVRGLTYDGTYIYATTGSNKVIYKINPTTKALVSSQTYSTVAFNLRGIAYDSTANSGAGGFWVSNFASDFVQVNRTGTIITSIPAATHTLTAVYGIAFDPYTSGGPYIWAADQGSSGTGCTLYRVSIATGAPTPVTHDVQTDYPGVVGGSLSITWRYRPGTWTIMGVGQATPPVLYGYELNDWVQATLDASADSIDFEPPYTIIPNTEIVPYNWTVKSTNNGATVISDLATQFRLTDSIVNYYNPAAAHDLNVASSSSTYNTFGPFTPAMGFYYMQANTGTGSQTDVVPNNDTLTVSFLDVSDSVYARDNSQATGSLGIGDGTGGTLGQYFTLTQSAYITSATFFLTHPTAGDYTSVDLYDFTGGLPGSILTGSADYTFTSSDTTGVVLTLPFSSGPYLAAPGDYFLGVNEHAFNVTLGRTGFNYHPNTTFVTFTGQPWAPSEQFGFPITYVLRLNIDPLTVNVPQTAASQFSVYPNPSYGKVYIHNAEANSEYVINVFDNLGQLAYSRVEHGLSNAVVDLSNYANGVYRVQLKSQNNVSNETVVISHN